MKSGLVDRAAYQRQRAVLLTARALASVDADRAAARALVLEALKFAPALVPAAALAGRLLAEDGEQRKAARMVEIAWTFNPHPDLADTYEHLRPAIPRASGSRASKRSPRRRPVHIEGALAVARAALDAQEFAIAREALAPLVSAPTQRVALLMARIEETQHGDVGRAREWMTRAVHARRDPVWTADGLVSDRWMPVSPVTGRLDAFEWKEPLAELASSGGAMIEGSGDRPLIGAPAPEAADPDAADHGDLAASLARRSRDGAAAASGFERVLPLAHAPDDPGPDPDAEPPPAEPADVEPPPEIPADSWGRLRQLFK